MKWNLVISLSLFGLFMALATVFIIPSGVEPFFWVPIFLICAYLIAKYASGKYFLHGLWVGIVNSVWITIIHVLLFTKYIFFHASESEMLAKLPKLGSPRVLMLIVGPLIGIASGILLGILSFLASKVFEPAEG